MEPDANITAKFKKLWVYYLVQSAMAAGVLAILFLVLGEDRMILISAIGSSAFVVFAMPKTTSATARVVIGSHFVGLLSGATFAFVVLPHYISYPVAVGIAIFLMVSLDLEHPPAAGTAIAAVTHGDSLDIWLAVASSVLILSLARYLLRNHLKDLI